MRFKHMSILVALVAAMLSLASVSASAAMDMDMPGMDMSNQQFPGHTAPTTLPEQTYSNGGAQYVGSGQLVRHQLTTYVRKGKTWRKVLLPKTMHLHVDGHTRAMVCSRQTFRLVLRKGISAGGATASVVVTTDLTRRGCLRGHASRVPHLVQVDCHHVFLTVRNAADAYFRNQLRQRVRLTLRVPKAPQVSTPPVAPAPPIPAPPATCESMGLVTVAGNCVTQQQWCSIQGGNWDSNANQCVQVVCGNVGAGGGNQQGGNCNTIIICSGNNNCNTQPPPRGCTSNCSPPTVTIMSYIRLNDVPVGKTSGSMPFVVSASTTGSVTVTSELGGISDCNSTIKQASVTFDLMAGNNNLCVVYYAPNDSAGVREDTITYTAIAGTAEDTKSTTFAITYPMRPE